MSFPVLLHTAIDARDCRALAEFYRELARAALPPGEEPPDDGTVDDADWLVLLDENGRRVVTVQKKPDTVAPTWPSEEVPMQMHMDFKVPSIDELERHRQRAEALGAHVLLDRRRRRRAALRLWRTRPGILSACSCSRGGGGGREGGGGGREFRDARALRDVEIGSVAPSLL